MSGRTQVTCTCSRGFLKNLLHGQICVCVMCQQGLQATLVFPSSSWFFGRWGCYCAKSAGWCLILTWKHHSHLLKENQVKQQSDELPVPSQQISLCFHSHSEDGWAKTSARELKHRCHEKKWKVLSWVAWGRKDWEIPETLHCCHLAPTEYLLSHHATQQGVQWRNLHYHNEDVFSESY